MRAHWLHANTGRTDMLFRMKLVALATLTLAAMADADAAAQGGRSAAEQEIARGRYLVRIAGCNDCHTAGYAMNNGNVPESEWLKGDKLGWRGPWGTTYATNLRLLIPSMSREQWIKHARSMQPRPPMPWFNVRAMSDQDLRAMHAYVTSLGPAGDPAPAYAPPDANPSQPYVQFP
jgi:mono/diheme cytochrome c family protein